MENGIKIIWTLVCGAVVIIVGFIFLDIINTTLTEQKCQPYISQIGQLNSSLKSCEDQLNQTKLFLNQCREEYNILIKENLTKKDVEDIKQELNLTNERIILLDQKFETVNNTYVKVYKQLFLVFSISLSINILFVLFFIGDFVSFTLFKFDIKRKVLNLVKKLWKREDKGAS